MLPLFWKWFDQSFTLAGDTLFERARKRFIVLMFALGIATNTGYFATFMLTGSGHIWGHVASLFFICGGLSALVLLGLYQNFRVFGWSACVLVLIMGTSHHIVFGGFSSSGFVYLWALISPFVALIAFGARAGLTMFGVYTLTSILLVAFDSLIATHGKPPFSQQGLMWMTCSTLIGTAVFVLGLLALTIRELEAARNRADDLLLSILPAPIAEQLKNTQDVIAESYPEVTVLFADIVDFTALTAGVDPQEVVKSLDGIFSEFDELAAKHGLEKIKTIGDAYMLAGGLPTPRHDHADAVAAFAFDALAAISKRPSWRGQKLQLRIGINTGPVVAGVIGRHKFIYDLWGDAVNTASRMESHGLASGIHVTEATFHKLEGKFEFENRGALKIKGKGEMVTYLLKKPLGGKALSAA